MSDTGRDIVDDPGATPAYRYTAALANEIERKWQDRWEAEHTFWRPTRRAAGRGLRGGGGPPKLYVLDMFPYPSGAGLHVGHPLGYIGTDVYARFKRMTGFNVLHAMGYDAFGLPAEQYAVQTGQHPRVTTEANIANMRRQLRALGLGHDPRRGVATTDVAYYRWTQWIFLQIFNSWYDDDADRARPIAELVAELESAPGTPGPTAARGRARRDRARAARRRPYRLAYLAEAPVNWCPALGTVLANEEVTAEGRSDRGNHPVFKRPLKQWMLRDHRLRRPAARRPRPARLARVDQADAAQLDRPQRRRRGRLPGRGARRASTIDGVHHPSRHAVRRDVHGARARAPAGRHDRARRVAGATSPLTMLAGHLRLDGRPAEAVARYREFADAEERPRAPGRGPREDRRVHRRASRRNPTNGEPIPIFIADYVLMGYGTGAIMAVPAHDQRDFEFAREFELPIAASIRPPDAWFARPRRHRRHAGRRVARGVHRRRRRRCSSTNDDVSLDGLRRRRGQGAIIGSGSSAGGSGAATVTYKLRDWLFSRQRYWGEPFPIVYDERRPAGRAPGVDAAGRAARDRRLRARTSSRRRRRRPCPSRRSPAPSDWVERRARPRRRARRSRTARDRTRCRSGPARAGTTCATSTRPTRTRSSIPSVERYWMGRTRRDGSPTVGVDLYVGGVEHAVLHLLYARFWHKVLFDLGHVSTPEPFQRLFNQGYDPGRRAYVDERGVYVEATEVVERDGAFLVRRRARSTREYGKMGKSLKNAVTPDDIYRDYGADTLRLYEMFMGPLDASRPWNTADIVGVHRFLQRLWRNVVDEETGELRRHRRAGRRRDPPPAAPHDRGGARRHGASSVQHRDRPADRAQQPADPGRGGARRGAA